MYSMISNCKYKVLIFAWWIFSSCQSQEQIPAPIDLIPKQQMAQILADLIILDQHYVSLINLNDQLDYNRMQFFSSEIINDKYQLQDSQAYHSYQYYLQHPYLFKDVLEIAIDSLEKLTSSSEELPQLNLEDD